MPPMLVVAVAATLWSADLPVLRSQIKSSDTLSTVERYLDYETVASPRISPEGNAIVFTRRAVDKMKDTWESSLWIMNTEGSNLRFLTKQT